MSSDSLDSAPLRLAAIVSSSDDAIISKDLRGIVTSWNQAAERMFGWTSEEMVGRSITTIIPGNRLGEEDEVLRRISAGLRVDHFETIRCRKDGSLVPISLTVSPIRDARGVVIGASKIARDISDRKRAEALIASAEAGRSDLQRRLMTLVEASGTLFGTPHANAVYGAAVGLAPSLVPADGYALWRYERETRQWAIGASAGVSSAFTARITDQMHGEESASVLFTAPLVVEDVDAAPAVEARREAFRAEGITSILAIPLVVRGEATGTLVMYYRTRHEFSEVEVQAARALGNLTAAAIATAELYLEQQRAREQADFLVESTGALATSLDYERTLATVARLAVPRVADWCAVHLVTASGGVELLALAHVDPHQVDVARAMHGRYETPESPYGVHAVIRSGQPVIVPRITEQMLIESARGDQERLDAVRKVGLVSYLCVPLRAHGRTLGAVTFATAESGRHFTPGDLRIAEDLARRAALAVDNARAYEEARRANRVKDDFLATLSHELRTPLNAILGYARMLRTGALDEDKYARAFDIVERNASALTRIVGDVLDVSRIVSGKLRLDVQPVDLPSVVDEAIDAVKPGADAKGIRVDPMLDRAAAPVAGDPDRLRQVAWNLLSNAVKFTPRGGRILVRLRRLPAEVELSVTDTGIGIPPEFLPHVFERFRQADSRFAREHGGLGLGLAITRHIVEMHGGTIEVVSEGQGHGTTFRVLLPMVSGYAEASREAAHPSAATAIPFDSLAGVHVLAVDDEPDALALVREILEGAGAQVTTAGSADAAFEALPRVNPDVLLADIAMPGVDGFELIARIRQSAPARSREIPAAALTAYARTEDRIHILRSGFQMHLPKPLDPSELIAVVSVLARKGS